MSFIITQKTFAEINFKPLLDKTERDLALKILDVMPELNLLSIGSLDAENIIIEFLDYNCSYCKKIHPELIALVKERNDIKLYYLQFPILSDSSRFYALTVLAVAMQNVDKALKVHDSMMRADMPLNEKKVENILKKHSVDFDQYSSDILQVELHEILEVSYFLGKRIGGRGTPTLVINNKVVPGYINKGGIVNLLNKD